LLKIDQNVLDWLLQPSQPSVRYRTLVDLLDYPPNSADVREAYSQIAKRGWARGILEQEKPSGYWDSRKDLYRPKYSATIWRLIVLADLGLTRKENGVRKSCELFLKDYARPDGGFDSPGSDWSRSEHCLTGNLIRTLCLCGYGDDPRVRSGYDWLVRTQMDDGGWHCFYEKAFGRGTLDCWEGLSAFAVLPRRKWTKSIKHSVERGAEFYLKRQLFKQGRKRYLPWFRFHYPVHYYYDILVGLDVVTSLGFAGDKRLTAALDILKEKRLKNGRWVLDSIHPDLGSGAGYRFRKRPYKFALEKAGEPSMWITLTALKVLKRVSES